MFWKEAAQDKGNVNFRRASEFSPGMLGKAERSVRRGSSADLIYQTGSEPDYFNSGVPELFVHEVKIISNRS